MYNNDLIISKSDFQRLSTLVNIVRSSEVIELLEQELERAVVVSDQDLPNNVVCMHSIVSYKECSNDKISIVNLVYPQEASIEENKISILTPVGSALIGLQVGQAIDWTFPNGIKRLEVLSVAKMDMVN